MIGLGGSMQAVASSSSLGSRLTKSNRKEYTPLGVGYTSIVRSSLASTPENTKYKGEPVATSEINCLSLKRPLESCTIRKLLVSLIASKSLYLIPESVRVYV